MKLFEYAVIKHEKTNKDGGVTEPAQILVQPSTVLARDEKQAAMKAARAVSEDDMDDIDRIEVVVRPF